MIRHFYRVIRTPLINRKIVCSIHTERQRHGFEYDKTMLSKFGLEKSRNYTSPYDALCGDIGVQVKCIKYGCAIEMGDYIRNKNKKNDFLLMVGFWDGEKENVVEEDIYHVDHQEFVSNLFYDRDLQMKSEMNLITNLHEDDDRWTDFRVRHSRRWKTFNNHIDIRFKRDHKSQKRIQCAISWKNYNKWFKKSFIKMSKNDIEILLCDKNNNTYMPSIDI